MGAVSDRFLDRHPHLLDEDRTSHATIRWVCRAVAPLEAWHRFSITGFERVPAGGCLLVANHSVGAIVEILLLLRAWYQHFGEERVARGLAHQVAWQHPLKLFSVGKIGAILAHPRVAERALERGSALLVFPGGDLEACRPFAARYEVTLGGPRTGFVRLARATRAPVVPLVFCGSHAAYLMMPGAEEIARLTGMRRLFGLKAFPMTLGGAALVALTALSLALPLLAPAAVAAFFNACVPLPARIEAEILDPIWPDDAESDDEFADRVRARMQASMDRMAATRLTPWG